MGGYILRRLFLVIPTLFGIMLINFALTQFVPGGPVEQMVAQLQGRDTGGEGAAARGAGYRGRQGVDEQRIAEIRAAKQEMKRAAKAATGARARS